MKPELLTAGLTALLHASLLVSGAWFFLLTHRKSSAARRSLLCRLTIAATLLLTGYSFLSALPRQTSLTPSLASSAALPQGHGMPAENLLLPIDPTPPAPSTATSGSPSVSLPSPVRISWQLTPALSRMLLLVWLAGSLWMSLLWFRSLLVRRRVLRHSTQAPHLASFSEASTLPGWPLVDEVRLIPSEITPCVWGLRKTILALPQSAITWQPDKLRLVLAHECAHLVRRDPLWQTLTHAFLALLWFHPLAWNLARRSQAADEQAADDAVLRTTPDAPSYAALLVECARHFSLPHPTAATTHAMATPANLTTRVEAILIPSTDRRPATFRSFLASSILIASIAAGLAFCTPGIVIAEEPTPVQPEAQPDMKAPTGEESPVIVSLENATVFGDKMLVPADKQPPNRREHKIAGSAKFSSPSLTIEADEMIYTSDESQEKKALLTLSARGSIRIKGLVGGHKVSATAEELWISNETGELTLKGRLEAKLGDNRIKANKAAASVTLKSKIFKMEDCTVIGPAGSWDPVSDQPSGNAEGQTPASAPKEPNADPAEGPSRTPSTTRTAAEPKHGFPSPAPPTDAPKPPFEWKPVSLNGRDFISLSQIKDFYYFPQLSTEESGNFIMQSNTNIMMRSRPNIMILRGSAGSRELFINNVKFLLAQPVQPSEDGLLLSSQDLVNILDPIIRPSDNNWHGKRQITTIVIDPGSGGDVAGGSGPAGNEAAFTLDTSLRLQRELNKLGLNVVRTRRDDTLLSREERTSLVAAVPDALFISLRFQTRPADLHGIQTFYPEAPPEPSKLLDPMGDGVYFRACVSLATAVHANNLYKLRSKDEGVDVAPFEFLTGPIRAPAILVDGGNPSHPEEGARIATEAYRQQLAEAIAGGVQNFIRAINKTERVPRRQ